MSNNIQAGASSHVELMVHAEQDKTNEKGETTHTVRPGETLSEIAKEHKMSLADLAALNPQFDSKSADSKFDAKAERAKIDGKQGHRDLDFIIPGDVIVIARAKEARDGQRTPATGQGGGGPGEVAAKPGTAEGASGATATSGIQGVQGSSVQGSATPPSAQALAVVLQGMMAQIGQTLGAQVLQKFTDDNKTVLEKINTGLPLSDQDEVLLPTNDGKTVKVKLFDLPAFVERAQAQAFAQLDPEGKMQQVVATYGGFLTNVYFKLEAVKAGRQPSEPEQSAKAAILQKIQGELKQANNNVQLQSRGEARLPASILEVVKDTPLARVQTVSELQQGWTKLAQAQQTR